MGAISLEQLKKRHMAVDAVIDLLKERDINIVFETGTCFGHLTYQLAEYEPLKQIITVELSHELFNIAKDREGINKDKIEFLYGDSKDLLPIYAKKIKEPVLWYLDAHYCNVENNLGADGSFPVFEEMMAIRNRPYADIVWVDDVHCMGHRHRLGQPWERLHYNSILSVFSDRVDKSIRNISDGVVIYLNV